MSALRLPTGEANIAPTGTAGQPTGKVHVFIGPVPFELEASVIIASPQRPDKLLFGAIHDPRLRMKKAIPLTLSWREQEVVAKSEDLEEFGYGRNLFEALDDFGKTVRELYHRLAKDQDRLGDHLKDTLSKLRTYLEERRTVQ